jgi:hypothetical protein
MAFEVLCLGSKIIQIITFISNTFRGCFMSIQICSMHIQNTLGGSWASVLCSYWLIPSLMHFFLALATSWRHQVLLDVH